MKILWITNIVLPEAQGLLLGKGTLKSTGGWLIGASEMLSNNESTKLTIATISKHVEKLTRLEGEKISYYLLPLGKGNVKKNNEYIPYWKKIREEVKPDVIHLHGTELSHGLAYIEACGNKHVCVSIQGLVSACANYYCHGLSRKEIFKSITPASVRFGGIIEDSEKYAIRGRNEIEIIGRVQDIIGRTSWDKARVWAINPSAKYHYGGETLRSMFYNDEKWQYNQCVPHSIFVSQASYPIKGLHMLLHALPLVKRVFPDVTVRVAGNDITCCDTFKKKILLGNYGNLIRKIIHNKGLDGNVSFTGPLDGDAMVREYLKANVFVCPSTVENSPNSLAEAQILGVPVIASYVGGVPDMMRGDEMHLYRFEEIEMLAYMLVRLFEQKDSIDTEEMRQKALERHDPQKNLKQLLQIYQSVKYE